MSNNDYVRLHPEFDSIDLGTRNTVSKIREIHLKVETSHFAEEFGVALAKELFRRNTIRFTAISESMSEYGFDDLYSAMAYYVKGLLEIRLEIVNGGSQAFNKSKRLMVTPIMQEALSCLGKVRDNARGWLFVPDPTLFGYDIDLMLKLSSILEVFQLDGLKVASGSMPKEEYGDAQVMFCSIIDGIVYARNETIHPSASYISVFLGLECLAKGADTIYAVPYDSLSVIHEDLLKEMVSKCF